MHYLYYDCHTHHPQRDASIMALETLHVTNDLVLPATPCTIGMHPWYIQMTTWQQDFERLASLAASPQVYAIGECGLDRNIDLPMSQQLVCFQQQIDLAQQLNKPLVVHCVRAYAEIVEIVKHYGERCPKMVLHGFNKNKATFKQLENLSPLYFSFGAALAVPQYPALNVLDACPIDRVLMETDDQTNYTIEDIYQIAADAKGQSLESWQEQIAHNFQALFGVIEEV